MDLAIYDGTAIEGMIKVVSLSWDGSDNIIIEINLAADNLDVLDNAISEYVDNGLLDNMLISIGGESFEGAQTVVVNKSRGTSMTCLSFY